jgi:hypothetical protein
VTDPQPDTRTPGQVAYEAFPDAGDTYPPYSEIDQWQRDSWEKVAAAVLDHSREGTTTELEFGWVMAGGDRVWRQGERYFMCNTDRMKYRTITAGPWMDVQSD